jgi:hypothetical protein
VDVRCKVRRTQVEVIREQVGIKSGCGHSLTHFR